ncbi:hypothetical protein RRG08_034197 [Elysia crispata]|uniref:Uncharacterized protein n=1 Tax=Elysia crispata TaxID=231223 RepID=A0AAE1DQA6_9GAST|nr:hypothetical protein RRG08_034197 [Elysia crispata]
MTAQIAVTIVKYSLSLSSWSFYLGRRRRGDFPRGFTCPVLWPLARAAGYATLMLGCQTNTVTHRGGSLALEDMFCGLESSIWSQMAELPTVWQSSLSSPFVSGL